MITRRRFSVLLSLVLSSSIFSKKCKPESEPLSRNALVVSTWDQSRANNLAIEVLNKADSDLLGAIEAAINFVEADPSDQSVGYGGRPDRDGKVTLDACVMDHKGNAGSVTYLQNIKHPISVARRVMEETPHVMLSGQGAYDFAIAQGFEKEDLLTEASLKGYQEWLKNGLYKPKANIEMHDTIGLLAMNKQGDIVGGCSTSGMAYKYAGRVGDSPIIGAGLFVDNEIGAATATGVGELVMRTCASFLVVEYMRAQMSPQKACEAAIQRIVDKTGNKDFQVGLIAINKYGEVGAYSILPGFVYSVTNAESNQLMKANSYYS